MKDYKIAIVFKGSIREQRGLFNAVRLRAKYLHLKSNFNIEVFVLCRYEPWYVRLLRKTAKEDRPKLLEFDNIQYNILWYKFSLVDYILQNKLHLHSFNSNKYYKNLSNLIRGFNLISAHSFDAAQVARIVSMRDKIPFFVTWHGSDIHTAPFVNKSIFISSKELLLDAKCNFFVSNMLRETAKRITPTFESDVLYNGIDSSFTRYDGLKKRALRKQFKVDENENVIAFVGNLIDIKNPYLLPSIFEKVIYKCTNKKVKFWIIGSGKEESQLKDIMHSQSIPCIFWGGQKPEKMPEFMNCIDVLVLPSKNEGLGLVLLEAIACGANAVGSKVGGIEEVLGPENVFDLNEHFVDDISSRIVFMINNNVSQSVDSKFSWEMTTEKEKKYFLKYIKDK